METTEEKIQELEDKMKMIQSEQQKEIDEGEKKTLGASGTCRVLIYGLRSRHQSPRRREERVGLKTGSKEPLPSFDKKPTDSEGSRLGHVTFP